MNPRPKLDITPEGMRITYPEFSALSELKWADVIALEASCFAAPNGAVRIFSLVHRNGKALELDREIPKFDRRIDEIAEMLRVDANDLARLKTVKSGHSVSIKIKNKGAK